MQCIYTTHQHNALVYLALNYHTVSQNYSWISSFSIILPTSFPPQYNIATISKHMIACCVSPSYQANICSLQHFIIYIPLFNNRFVLQAKNGELDAKNAKVDAKNAELDAKNAHLETKMSLLLEEHQKPTNGICSITCLHAFVCRCVRLHVCMCACVCAWVCGCARVCVWLCSCVFVRVRACSCVSVRVRVSVRFHACSCVYEHVRAMRAHVCLCVFVRVYACVCVSVRVRACSYVFVRFRTIS